MKSIAALIVLLLAGTAVAEQPNWNQFRGPDGDGKTGATGLPVTWSDTENVVWKTPIHGKGWSSPVVWDDQIWMTTASEDGKQMSAVCVDFNSGKVVHDVPLFENAEPRYCHPQNSYASPTPVVEAGRLYVHFGSYGTACVDTTKGAKIWERRDLICNHWRAPGSSPIVHSNLLIVAYDGYDNQFVIAFDKQTGETAWQVDRNIEYGTDNGDHKKAYSTAKIIQHEGRSEMISPGAVATIAYDPETGKELWKVYHGGMNAAPRPLFANGLIYITGGAHDLGLIAVRPGGTGDVTDSHIVWGKGRGMPKRGSQIIVDDLMFAITDDGIAICLDAKTGDQIWKHRIGGDFWASPLYAEGRIYGFNKDGDCPVFEASDKFKLLANNKLPETICASPAVVGNSLIIRTQSHLYRIEK
ncbi:PQQ-binding-like beta-propeller repeat protein [Rosistilla oblonga]|uniref:outer membrane protein assembly factor BamB family protein n=1 Tax=Rosistilla oblonga TaxID=2527990 RepID=UPI003A9706EF